MLISGTGITPFNCKLKPDFQPVTKLSLSWFQLSSGNYGCTDRGAASDKYEAENVQLYADETVINNFIDELEQNRQSGSNQIVLSNINATEHIFGADVDYSTSIVATAFIESREQGTWKGFRLPMRLVAVSPSFVAVAGSLPPLKILGVGYSADADRMINKIRSYTNVFTYADHQSDSGVFTGTFTFNNEDMIQIRRYIAVQRSATISIPAINGVAYPFGRRSTSYPYSVKVIDFTDNGMLSPSLWSASITFSEVI